MTSSDASRAAIFDALERGRAPAPPEIRRVAPPPMPDDPLAVTRARLEQNGGRFHHSTAGGWLDDLATTLGLSEAEHVFCAPSVGSDAQAPPLRTRGVGANPGDVRELAELEACVLRGEFAVVENGAVWHRPASERERAAALLAEALVLVVDASQLVASMHDAYARIDLAVGRFGWFLGGPSKTADIEQALVLGAHGPRSMHLVLLDE